MGDGKKQALQVQFDRRVKLEFHLPERGNPRAAAWWLAALGLVFGVLSTSEAAGQTGGVPELELKHVCGALFRDDFTSDTLNASLWTINSHDPGIKVQVERGELCVRGTGSPISPDSFHQQPFLLQHCAGVWSRRFTQRDVALAVRVKIPSGIAPEPGSHVVNIHLCGVYPDVYPEVLFGKLESAPTKKLYREYAGFQDLPWHDARGWWFSVVQGTPTWQKVGEAVPELGDERDRFHEVVVAYDEPTQMAHAHVNLKGQWKQLGRDRYVSSGATMVELKMISITDQPGFQREARFDDCRLYPNPRRHPIRFIVSNGELPYGGPSLRVELRSRDGKRLISQGNTDKSGMVSLPVDDPAWVAFPVSAMAQIYQDRRELGRGVIEAQGIEGLYPGDVWVADVKQSTRAPK